MLRRMSRLSRLAPVLCLLLAPAVARADTASDAREEIERRNIPYQMSEMCRAAQEGDVEVVRLFLDAGPNVNLKDWSDMTPLQSAAMFHQPEVARLLLERGADPEITSSHDETALHVAIEGGWNEMAGHATEGGPETVRAIVDAGANLDAQ